MGGEGGFIHPNPSGLLTRRNSLHSFHSHLDSLPLSFFPLSLICSPFSFLFPSLAVLPRLYPLLFFFTPCLFFCELSPYLSQCKYSVMNAHPQVGRDAGRRREFLSLPLSSAAVLTLCWCSGLILDSPVRASTQTHTHTYTDTHAHTNKQMLTSCFGPGLAQVLYPLFKHSLTVFTAAVEQSS